MKKSQLILLLTLSFFTRFSVKPAIYRGNWSEIKHISRIPRAILIAVLLLLTTNQLSAAVSINITKTDVTCGANGSIVVEVTGATAPVITYAIKKAGVEKTKHIFEYFVYIKVL